MEENFTEQFSTLPSVPSEANLVEVAKTFLENDSNIVVVNRGNEILGYIGWKDIIKLLISGGEDLRVKAEEIARPIKEEEMAESIKEDLHDIIDKIRKHGRMPVLTRGKDGIRRKISPEMVITQLANLHDEERKKRTDIECLINNIIEIFPIGVTLISNDGNILFSNKIANDIISGKYKDSKEFVKIFNRKQAEVVKYKEGKFYRICSTPIKEGFLVTFADISNEYNMVEKLRSSQHEVEVAFTMMLPDQRIETRLKSIVEYIDQYDEKSGMIKITGVIKEGCFRHVVNMLKLIADALNQGLLELPGMDKNTIVQTAILHDIGKVQPSLKIGDIVNPKEVLEKGYLHAFRSAELSKALYNIDEKVYNLIKFHHHEESELPKDFPEYLLPMYRFFRLIDGLSAGITRRGSKASMTIKGTKIFVKEESNFPDYNQEIEMDIYTGYYERKKSL